MNDSEEHAQKEQQDGWAVWVKDGRSRECIAVLADDQETAESKALTRAADLELEEAEVDHVDGPFPGSDPGIWEFKYTTEHLEIVRVEAPNEDYAKESADAERDHRGQYKRTVHTESRKVTEVDDGAE